MHPIYRIRTAKGISQNELAEMTGVSQSVISYIEVGKTEHPRIDTLLAIAAALGCTINDLIDHKEGTAQ